MDGAVSDVALLKSLETKTFFQVRIACLLWNYDEKGARSLLDDAQGLMASMMNDPKIKPGGDFDTWVRRTKLREELVPMIAERDPQAALEFLRETKFVIPQDSMQSDRARDVLRWDTRLEQKLASQVAKNDPKRALEIAEESLKKGISPELNELVRVVFEKDKEAGKKFARAILSKLKISDHTDNLLEVGIALSILEEEYASRRPESSAGENPPGAKKRQPVLDDQTIEGNFELARKITEEHITDPDVRKHKMERIDEMAKQHFLDHGKIEDAAAALMSLESDVERATRLADLAGRASKSGDKNLAAELLEKALRFLLQPVETREEYEAMIRIIHNSIGIDSERSFEMFGSLIDPINQLVTATIQTKRFEGKRSDLQRDEMPLDYLRQNSPPHEARGEFPVKGFVEVIAPLSKADFDRSIGLADRIRKPELKLRMKLLAIQAAMSE